ncbi:GMC oxidoreductase [Cadophora sp. DSE1049]|nr:GMC oxidoreductase [Cadophora sp. DSE1049]
MISTPALAFHLLETEYDWGYETTMVDSHGYRRVEKHNTRGKVLGGSSALNYFKYWGGEDWTFEKCRSFFKKGVSFADERNILGVEPPDVGSDGPLKVSPTLNIPLAAELKRAWTSRGYPITNDIFDGTVNGTTHLVRSIYRAIRSVSTNFIQELLLEGQRVIEVETHGMEGRQIYLVEKEVIISCGVFETPKLLMLSVDSPNVGKHLQDHPILPHVFQVKDGYSLDHVIRPGPQHDQAALEYKKYQSGPMASGLLKMSAFTRINERLRQCKEWRDEAEHRGYDPLGPRGQPHFELDFIVGLHTNFGCSSHWQPAFATPFQPHIAPPLTGSYLTVVVDLLRPLSRGKVTLRSANFEDPPHINLNFLEHPVDIIGLREGVRFINEVLLRGDGMTDVITDEYPEQLPRHSDDLMRKKLLERVSTSYHPCGSCHMGRTIEGVVDGCLKVFGVKGLRVVDASVMPVIPDGRVHRNEPCHAERSISRRAKLTSSAAVGYVAKCSLI